MSFLEEPFQQICPSPLIPILASHGTSQGRFHDNLIRSENVWTFFNRLQRHQDPLSWTLCKMSAYSGFWRHVSDFRLHTGMWHLLLFACMLVSLGKWTKSRYTCSLGKIQFSNYVPAQDKQLIQQYPVYISSNYTCWGTFCGLRRWGGDKKYALWIFLWRHVTETEKRCIAHGNMETDDVSKQVNWDSKWGIMLFPVGRQFVVTLCVEIQVRENGDVCMWRWNGERERERGCLQADCCIYRHRNSGLLLKDEGVIWVSYKHNLTL
jgi:hypothetical protein